MSTLLFTLSGAERAALCAGSMALPRAGHLSAKADAGSGGHEYTQVLIEHGREEANDRVEEIAERWGIEGEEATFWFARMRAWDPNVGAGAICELPLAYFEDGAVVRVVGGRGSYDVDGRIAAAHGAALFAGSIDCAWTDPEPLRWVDALGEDGAVARAPAGSTAWLTDWKFGDQDYVPPIRRNLQVRLGAVLFSRWSGAERAVPAICFPGPGGGRWDVDLVDGAAVPIGAAELATIEARARETVERGQEQRRRLAMARPLDLVTGAHCEYCPCRPACPAHLSEVRALVTGGIDFAMGRPLTVEEASRLAAMLSPAGSVLRRASAALKAYVEEHGAIALPDGRVWGPQPQPKTRLRTRETFEELLTALVALVGEEQAGELADAAFQASKKAVRQALSDARERAGLPRRGIGKALGALLEAVRERGGESSVMGQRWSAHYPGQVAEEDDAA